MRRRGAAAAAGYAAAADDGVGGDEGDAEGALGVELFAWNDSNHECVLFSSSADHACFLSLDPKAMRSAVHPHLLEHLEANGVRIGEGLEALNARHHQVLGALTGVARGPRRGGGALSGRYCLTGDSLEDARNLCARVRCGIPVVLMGECGCGKTMLIQYLCAGSAPPSSRSTSTEAPPPTKSSPPSSARRRSPPPPTPTAAPPRCGCSSTSSTRARTSR